MKTEQDQSHQNSGRFSRDRALAHALLRLALGTTIFLHGTNRIASGVAQFAESMVKQFAQTPLPVWSVQAFGTVLPFVEATVGLLLVLGLWLRWALVIGALSMVSLIFGTTLRSDFQTVGLQLVYALIYFALLFTRQHDAYSLDGWRSSKSRRG